MPIVLEIIFPVFVLIGVGYGAARAGRFPGTAVRAVSDVTFLIFMPALLFGALARVDIAALSPGAAFAYYGAGLPLFAVALLIQHWRGVPLDRAVIVGLCGVFANTAMLGIPLVRLAYGEEGLAFLLTIIALHALVFLTLGTLLIELWGGSRAAPGEAPAGPGAGVGRQLALVVRSSLIHPVVLPILAGLAFSAAGLHLPAPLEKPLNMLAGAAPPLCLVLLGASLAQFDLRQGLGPAVAVTAMKSLVHPLAVFAVGKFLFELPPMPLAVATVTAALPVGANVYLFAQRYRAGVDQASAAVALSTLAAAASLPLLLFALPGS